MLTDMKIRSHKNAGSTGVTGWTLIATRANQFTENADYGSLAPIPESLVSCRQSPKS